MNNHIEEIKHKNHTIKVFTCEPFNPREDCNLGIISAWHKKYNLGDEHLNPRLFESAEQVESHLITDKGAIFIKPVYCYEHGNIVLSHKPFDCPWDSGIVGFIYITKESAENTGLALSKTSDGTVFISDKAHAERILNNEIELYSKYLNGDGYGWCVYDENNELVNRCSGYFSVDEALESAKEDIGL